MTSREERKKSYNVHGLGGNHLDDSGISRLDELGEVLNGLTGTTVDLLEKGVELASNLEESEVKKVSKRRKKKTKTKKRLT